MTFRIRPEQAADQTITINLTPDELETLRALIAKDGNASSVAGLIESFVADLTGSHRTNGSDERRCAFDWFKRQAHGYIESFEAQDWL